MTVFPALRRISSAFKPVSSLYYYGGVTSGRGLRTSPVTCSGDPASRDAVVTIEQLKAMLASRNVQLFDIRNADEFQAGRIPSAVNIPLGQLEESLQLPPKAFETRFKVKAPKKEDDNIVFHCQKGRRSLNALEIAWRLGFTKARHYADAVVTIEQLKAMLAGHSVQLFDVRNPGEFQAGCIPGAVNIPLGQLEESLQLPPKAFEKRFEVKAPKKEDDNIVFHCRTGRRSLSALEIAWRLGFTKARHYEGGYVEWAEKEKK
ncbi:hypothetical protein NFI96_034677 [Prochilodus magdalenae]|nr:hypothetical protein NFI96_034677 [Prochilodus magdalenae]